MNGVFQAPRTFGQKLRILIIAASCSMLALMVYNGRQMVKSAVEEKVIEMARVRLEAMTREVDDVTQRVAVLPLYIAARQKALGDQPDPDTPRVLFELLKATPPDQASGIYIAFDAKDYREKDAVQWVKDRKHFDQYSPVINDYHKPVYEWYHGPKTTRKLHVTEPYLDQDGANIWMVSVTQPVVDASGRFIGVAGVDLGLDLMSARIKEICSKSVGADETGAMSVSAYLVSDRGEKKKVFAHSSWKVAARGSDGGEDLLSFLEGRDVAGSVSGQMRIDPKGSAARYVMWQTAKLSGWKVVLSVPEATIRNPVWWMTVRWLWIDLLGLGLMVGTVSLVARWVTGPIPRLAAAAAAVEAGDYRGEDLVPIARRSDEFGRLARGFRRMIDEVSTREGQLKLARDELSRSERHFRSLIENASDIITVLSRDGTILYKSPSVTRLLGYSPEELRGQSAFEQIHPEDRGVVADHLALHVRGDGRPLRYRHLHRDGSYRTLEAISTDLTEDPAVGGIVVNSRDVTEREIAETEVRELNTQLRELNADLDRRVKLKTAELQNKMEELEAAKDATDAAMKAQESLLSNVAHDLRTPLTIVIGYSQDLLRKAKKKGQDAFVPDLKLIVNRGNDLLELINDLLNLSKAMNDKGVDIELTTFDVAGMIRDRMEGIGTVAQKYGNTVEFRPAEGLGAMTADAAKVWRVLMNLLSNACKFTKDGTIVLEAAREPADNGDGDRIVFQVRDTGMGMNPEQLARLFHRFEQVDASSAKRQLGVGLGLSICLLYCRAMGGEIRVESEVGKGTTFTVRLPAEVRPAAPPPRAPKRADERPAPADTANLILIIDDDASVCELMRRNLGDEGYQTRAASSGEEGLRLAKQLHPSAIILDIVMPGIDGWAVLAALKTDAETIDIPIIMASMLDEKERGYRLGADDYVTKPFGRDRLTEIIRKHVGGRPSARLLVVEDDPEARGRLRDALRGQGWTVSEASDGFEALARIEADRPDLVLMDLMLPRMNGFEVIEEIRKHKAWESVPVIVITGAEINAEVRHRLESQVEQILQKGLFSRDQLLEEIRALVASHRRGHPPPIPEAIA
ncbi:MAG: response regulator [Planctomycetaceae bacterium]|nr:response regulator [Planctomycetaceae bacterium]MBV8383089.1 response regulator [Planctomycetaceae bacterium]